MANTAARDALTSFDRQAASQDTAMTEAGEQNAAEGAQGDNRLQNVQASMGKIQNTLDTLQTSMQAAQTSLASMQMAVPAIQNVTNLMQTKLDTYLYPERRANLGEASPYFGGSGQSQQTSQASSHGGPQTASSQPKPRRRDVLAAVAAETKNVLPGLLKKMPYAAPNGTLFSANTKDGHTIHKLDRKVCPKLKGAKIKVVSADTINAALELAETTANTTTDGYPVVILNLASEFRAGGGWLRGALAQEEALCYRTSLSFTLKIRYYPLPELSCIYSPSVVVIRESLATGHKLLDLSKPDELPVISAISVAALRKPILTRDKPTQYRNPQDRETMKEKMRIVLRVAAFHGHRRLVLGALGCGAFMNPKEEVAYCWAEVFAEQEFSGGWWEHVVFAVLDDGRGVGNFAFFEEVLHGQDI